MSNVGKRVIYAGPADGVNTHAQTVEGKAAESTLPGSLVARTATGLKLSDSASTVFGQELLFANKNEMGTSLSVDDAWAADENMIAFQARSGEFYNVRVAASQDITTAGTPLTSNGDGTLKKAATDSSDDILCYADEVVNTGASVALVRVRIK